MSAENIPLHLKPLTGSWKTKCSVCEAVYDNGVGSSPCCGALQYIIETHPALATEPQEFCQWCYYRGLRYSSGPWRHAIECPNRVKTDAPIDLERTAQLEAELEWLYTNCKIVHWPDNGDYPIEHNPMANKDCRVFLDAERAKHP